MKTITFVAITLLCGAIAGTILGVINQGIVEPYIERAIEIETQNAVNMGEIINPTELAAYRLWQRSGEIVAGTILGLSMGSLFGIVFAYARDSLPGSNNKKKALVLAGIMWLTLFFVPALKYPANPPAVGDPETIYYRQLMYIIFVVISGLSALGLAFVHKKIKAAARKKQEARQERQQQANKPTATVAATVLPIAIAAAMYAAIMVVAYLTMPPNPDPIIAPADLIFGFRIASGLTMSMFWALLGIVLGAFWDKLRPHETAKIKAL